MNQLSEPADLQRFGNFKLRDNSSIGIMKDKKGFTHLVCKCDVFARKYWCNHVQEAYMQSPVNLRVEDYAPAIVGWVQPTPLVVPTVIIPVTNFDGSASDLRRVDVVWGEPEINPQTGTLVATGGDTLGFIHKDDYRREIRRLLVEWLPGLIVRPDLICKASTHRKGDSLLDEEITVDGFELSSEPVKRRVLTDLFSILDMKRCYACDVAMRVPF